MRVVYILKWDRHYVWSTNDIERRLKEHRKYGYSAKRIWDRKLVKTIECAGRLEARRLELKIKKWWHIERWI